MNDIEKGPGIGRGPGKGTGPGTGNDGSAQQTDASRLVPILITEDLTELEVVRALLESAGIPTMTSGQEQAQLLGTHLLSGLFGKQLMGARLLVQQADSEEAKAVISAALEDQPTET